MFGLLVNAPTGQQEIVMVEEGGGYFDQSRVLWDERLDGPLPVITIGGMVRLGGDMLIDEATGTPHRVGGELVFSQARMDEHTVAITEPLKAKLIEGVDAHIAGIYSKWMRFEAEYVERETAARAYKAAGYTGVVSEWIARFATNSRMTAQDATDLIISQADGLRGALVGLGNLRMDKYLISKKVNGSDATQAEAQAQHDAIIAAANVIAAALS
jgi:hypothetical protein